MDEGQSATDRRFELLMVLNALTTENGVRRNDLLDILSGELRRYWGIDPNERDLETVRAYVIANLRKLIREHIKPVRTSRAAAYRYSVMASFNVLNVAELRDANPTARREWVQNHANKELQASEKSSRTWLAHAIRQIEQILASGRYTPASLDEFEALGIPRSIVEGREAHSSGNRAAQAPTVSNQVENGRSVQTANPPPQSLPPKQRRFWKPPIAVTGTIVLALAAGTIGVLSFTNFEASHTECDDAARALSIKSYGPNDIYNGWSVVYSADRSNSARQFLARVDQAKTPPEDYDKFLNEELDAGAYLYRGMTLMLEFTGLDKREVIIRDIRPIIHERPEVPAEAAIFLSPQGDDRRTEVYFCLRRCAVSSTNKEYRKRERARIPAV